MNQSSRLPEWLGSFPQRVDPADADVPEPDIVQLEQLATLAVPRFPRHEKVQAPLDPEPRPGAWSQPVTYELE
jgi:hypothetical protein